MRFALLEEQTFRDADAVSAVSVVPLCDWLEFLLLNVVVDVRNVIYVMMMSMLWNVISRMMMMTRTASMIQRRRRNWRMSILSPSCVKDSPFRLDSVLREAEAR